MSLTTPETGQRERPADGSGLRVAYVIGAAILVLAAVAFATAPFGTLLGPSKFAVAHGLHAVMAFVFVIISSIGLYLAYMLFANRIQTLHPLQFVVNSVAALSAFTIGFGDWLYIGYRAAAADSPKSWFLAHTPVIHDVFFEFKEHIALFTFPLAFAAAFILWHYGTRAIENRYLRFAIASALVLNFIYFAVAFGLGAAITKLRGV